MLQLCRPVMYLTAHLTGLLVAWQHAQCFAHHIKWSLECYITHHAIAAWFTSYNQRNFQPSLHTWSSAFVKTPCPCDSQDTLPGSHLQKQEKVCPISCAYSDSTDVLSHHNDSCANTHLPISNTKLTLVNTKAADSPVLHLQTCTIMKDC